VRRSSQFVAIFVGAIVSTVHFKDYTHRVGLFVPSLCWIASDISDECAKPSYMLFCILKDIVVFSRPPHIKIFFTVTHRNQVFAPNFIRDGPRSAPSRTNHHEDSLLCAMVREARIIWQRRFAEIVTDINVESSRGGIPGIYPYRDNLPIIPIVGKAEMRYPSKRVEINKSPLARGHGRFGDVGPFFSGGGSVFCGGGREFGIVQAFPYKPDLSELEGALPAVRSD
jgi:hypothetical protein